MASFMPYLLVGLGFVLLVAGADMTVRAAVSIARRLGISMLVVGLTVVAFGTSVPELAVGVAAVLHGSPDLVMGNVIGSNVANVGLILGTASLLMPVAVSTIVFRREGPFLVFVTLLWFGLAYDLEFGRLDALIYLGVLVVGLVLYVRVARRELEAQASDGPVQGERGWWALGGMLALGIVLLAGGGEALVRGAIDIARGFGVSERVIGLTIVAIGTSLPELATSVAAALHGEADVSIGNVVGSNILNLLVILGVVGLLQPLAVDPRFFYFDVPLSLVFVFATFFLTRGARLTRTGGVVLLLSYTAYMVTIGLGIT